MVGSQEKHIQEEIKGLMCPNSSRTPLHWNLGSSLQCPWRSWLPLETLQLLWWSLLSYFKWSLLYLLLICFFIKMLNKGKKGKAQRKANRA